MAKIKRLLIANRGEVALRLARTCKALNITSIATVASNEKKAAHVQACNESVLLSGSGTAAYLDAADLIRAAKAASADAVHPGYGFLSESAAFAKAVIRAGLNWVGPTPEAMEALGDKVAAKSLAEKAKVPTLPSVVEKTSKYSTFAKRLQKMPFPILIKPSAGGGGKGMTPVFHAKDLSEAISQARHEAMVAFGDDRLLAEPFLKAAKHVEVQILGDKKGNVRHLFERDCSLQRRRQKIIEESPSPRLDEKMREALLEAAVRLAKTVGYQNAGTIEFLIDSEDRFYFMEMNTRLQVEHPVTEMRLGVDLVAAQIAIAEGATVDQALGALKPSGHVIEARVYAEDPHVGFLPSSGKILTLELPGSDVARIDTGIAVGMNVSSDFDPMLLKVIVKGKDRDHALLQLNEALCQTILLGVTTNLGYLQWVTKNPSFRKSVHDIAWAERTLPEFQAEALGSPAGAIAAVMVMEERRRQMSLGDEDEIWTTNPWNTLGSFRLGEHA